MELKQGTSFVIINGFDRSGTSAISRTLAKHSDIELLMQPFNSGFIRKRMYEVFGVDESKEVSEAREFFNCLRKNRINNELIYSHWHHKHSTTKVYIPGRLHVLKTTINHFAQKWMKDNFPDIHVWGIWRNPVEIVTSILHNNFYGKWYEEAIDLLTPTIKSVEFLRDNYAYLIPLLDSELKRTSFLVAVRTHFFLKYLDADKLIDYHLFKEDANAGLRNFCDLYQLSETVFNKHSKIDLNIIGDSFTNNKKINVTKEDEEFMEAIFSGIHSLKKIKFDHDKVS